MPTPARGSIEELNAAYRKVKKILESQNPVRTREHIQSLNDQERFEALSWATLDYYFCLAQCQESKDGHMGVRDMMKLLRSLKVPRLEDLDAEQTLDWIAKAKEKNLLKDMPEHLTKRLSKEPKDE